MEEEKATRIQENMTIHDKSTETNYFDDTIKNNASDTTNEDMTFDDLLYYAGEFGPYQILMVFATFPFYIMGVCVYYSQIFMTEASTQYWCRIPELENLTADERRVLSIPLDENGRYGYSQCQSYVANWTEVLLTGNGPNPSWQTQKCQHGWEFDMSEIPYPTLVKEWEWVCDKKSYQATAQSIFFAGSIIGGVIFGWMADKQGRLPVIIGSNAVALIGGVASVFTRNFVEFTICRFIMGIAYDNCLMMPYLLVIEYIAPKHRTMVANMSFAVFYAFGAVVIPWISLACGHWKTIGIVTSIPMIIAFFAPFVFLESSKWLLSKGRVDDALSKLNQIARKNKKEVPQQYIESFKVAVSKQKQEEHASLFEVFKRPLLRRGLLCICVSYMCCTIIFDALIRSLGQLDFDFFLSFSLVSCTELPALLLLAFFMDLTGRRWLSVVGFLVVFTFCLAIAFVGSGLISVTFAVIARFAINLSMSAAMQWSAEILPTPVRGSGVSFIHICGSLATVIAPYVVYLETIFVWLPMVVIAGLGLLGALVTLGLPETAKKDLPQTFDDAEDLVKTDKLWDIPCLAKPKEVEKIGQVNESFQP